MKKFFLILFLISFVYLYCNVELFDAINAAHLKIALKNLNRFCDDLGIGLNIGLATVGILTYKELKKIETKTLLGSYPIIGALSLTFVLGVVFHGALYLYKKTEAKKITKKIMQSDVTLCINNS